MTSLDRETSGRADLPPPRRNIELKARLRCLDRARQQAQQISTSLGGTQIQRDTYFVCSQGRLKLREIDSGLAQLIWYQRANDHRMKSSEYIIQPLSDAPALKQILSRAYGIGATVNKRREIFFYHNVRIHLDEVENLGVFLEFEALQGPNSDEAYEQRQLNRLSEHFGIAPSDLLADSYGEQILDRHGTLS